MHHSHQIFGLCKSCQAKTTDDSVLAHRLSQLST
jgi:hypothetical protein